MALTFGPDVVYSKVSGPGVKSYTMNNMPLKLYKQMVFTYVLYQKLTNDNLAVICLSGL